MDDARYCEILEFVSETGLAIRSRAPEADARIEHALGLLGEIWHELDPNAARATIRTARAEWWVYDEALKRAFASVEGKCVVKTRSPLQIADREAQRGPPTLQVQRENAGELPARHVPRRRSGKSSRAG